MKMVKREDMDEFSEGYQAKLAFKNHMVMFYRIGAIEIIRFRRILSYEVPAEDGTVYDFLTSYVDYQNRPDDFEESTVLVDKLQKLYLSCSDSTELSRAVRNEIQTHIGFRTLDPLNMLVRYIGGVPALQDGRGFHEVDLTGIFLTVNPMALDMLVAHILKRKFDFNIEGVSKDEMIAKINQILKG